MFEKEQLENAPPLSGKFDNVEDMTELERAVAEHQGLLTPEGDLKEDAKRKPPKKLDLPGHLEPPMRLEDLSPDAGEVNRGIEEMKARLAKEAEAKKGEAEGRLDQPLPPPSFDAAEPPPTSSALPLPAEMKDVAITEAIVSAKEPIPCGHCGWDIRQTFQPPKVSEDDKAAFIRHVMSRTGRFYKSYKLFDLMTLEMRSLTQTETDEILRQLRKDTRSERIETGGEFSVQLQRYQVAASVRRIMAFSGEPENKVKEIAEAEIFPTLDELVKQKTDEPVRHLEQLVIGENMPTGLYSALVAVWLEFSRLYGWLSSHAHESSFWQAAAGSRS